eukprot:CAMPEP_0202712646 /NCGR_PEP_ID=MMETSP1385-20130828/43558_1 /ASSEMBLY_ACC=CAM_ASM_000861 /TAXON_ID=933848 /ORGANISM="Elphidium margaritaceum" /LENGTH=256 /DNA_ID=CAMNT_0049372737 /DNA_START=9 /DNA_END=779 /DNA_ORIENTATION=+
MSQAEIKQWAENQENLDIYQVNAFIFGTGQYKFYPIGLWKLTACIGLQIFGIIILTDQVAEENGFMCPDAQVCQGYNGSGGGESGQLAWMAFFFVSFVSITCAEQLRGLGDLGMYSWGSNQPEFVSKIWVCIGLYTNVMVLLLCWLCSVIIVFASKSLLDMVLNAVAVLFMITIDDEIVTFSDYDNVLATMASYSSKNAASRALDKCAEKMLNLQVLWSKPWLCSVVMLPLTIAAPLFTIICYGPAEFSADCVAAA